MSAERNIWGLPDGNTTIVTTAEGGFDSHWPNMADKKKKKNNDDWIDDDTAADLAELYGLGQMDERAVD